MVTLAHVYSIYRLLPCFWNIQFSDNVLANTCPADKTSIVHWNSPKKRQGAVHALPFQAWQAVIQELRGDLLRSPRWDLVPLCSSAGSGPIHSPSTNSNTNTSHSRTPTSAVAATGTSAVVRPSRGGTHGEDDILADAACHEIVQSSNHMFRVHAFFGTRYDHAMYGHLPAHGIGDVASDVTLVTQLSMTRLPLLEGIARAWAGLFPVFNDFS